MKAILAACAVTALGAGTAFGQVLSQSHTPSAGHVPTQAGPPLIHSGGPEADVAVPTVGIPSFDAVSAPGNTVQTINIAVLAGFASGTPMTMTGIGWNNNITANGVSWLSDNGVYFDDNIAPDLSGLFLRIGAGAANDHPGTQTFNSGGVLDLTDNGVPDISLPNGMLRLEFYEDFDDAPGAADGSWNSGNLTVQAFPVPEPTSIAAIGLVGAGILGRRRRK